MRTHVDAAAEDGIALFYALLVALVVGGVIVVTFASALGETRQSAFELDFEDALHVAEGGAEIGLQAVKADPTITNASNPEDFGGSEWEWALNEARSLDEAAWDSESVRIGEGEAIWLRPSTGLKQYVYGVGFVPSRTAYVEGDGRPYVRVVRMEVGFTEAPVPGEYAFLGNRVLTFGGGGNSSIYGANGSVHTNGTFDPPNSSNFTFSGTVSFHECDAPACEEEGYQSTSEVVPLNVAETPKGVYQSEAAQKYMLDENDEGHKWYDYCDGTWMERTDSSRDAEPCVGGNVLGGSPPGFTGTTQDESGGGAEGVYYFDGDVDVVRQPFDARMTIITGGSISTTSGNETYQWLPAYERLHAYAADDVDWGNVNVNAEFIDCSDGVSDDELTTASGVDPGIVYAGDDLTMAGNPTAVQISFIAGDSIIFGGGGGSSRCVVLQTDASGDLGGIGEAVLVSWAEPAA